MVYDDPFAEYSPRFFTSLSTTTDKALLPCGPAEANSTGVSAAPGSTVLLECPEGVSGGHVGGRRLHVG